MTLWNRLSETIGNPLEWRSSEKNLFILGILWLLHLGFVLWAVLVLGLRLGPATVLDHHVAPHLPWLLGLLGLNTLLLLSTLWLRRGGRDGIWHEHLSAQWYALALVTLGHFTGTLSLATGVVLAGAPVVGFMFLNRGPVLAAMATALIGHLCLTWAAAAGLLPYGGMLGPERAADGSPSTFWVVNLYLFTAPQFIFLAALSSLILTRWRQREAEARLLSLTDALTHLPNRRAIMAQLTREVEQSRRSGLPLAVVMMDLDRFKRLNDTHGHPAGDAVLVAVAETLGEALRQSDMAGRYGGEEFMILLHGADNHGASLLAERCRQALEEMTVDTGDGEPLTVTASFGLCSNEKNPALTPDEMVERADVALYRAKNQGRNRVEIAGDDRSDNRSSGTEAH